MTMAASALTSGDELSLSQFGPDGTGFAPYGHLDSDALTAAPVQGLIANGSLTLWLPPGQYILEYLVTAPGSFSLVRLPTSE